jgi:hypothetical protein
MGACRAAYANFYDTSHFRDAIAEAFQKDLAVALNAMKQNR